ncbi:protein kinase [Nocardia sp. NPDC049220]|uniref:serine/threonine-protein kinase n=1 Tax=Nocardia sp. NPDC049220 TaxID=3155273 RepID=UPI0033D962AE
MQEPGPRTGTRFGPYELRSLLGKGGMGEVYEAYDTLRDRVVAVKLLSEELARDPVYQVRFRRESQAAARLTEPHVIPIHDWGVIDGVLFIDMRLVPGVDLRTILRGQGPLSPARAVGIIEQIASALEAAHTGNLVHRDVKPANILVTDADFAYLADFGIAHTEGDSAVTLVGMAVGSYIYMAPERFDTAPVTGRADIYSLACVLHECLTGATPFPAASMNVLIKSHLSDPPPRPSAQAGGVPAALDAVISRGMAKDPADRFATATALARAARAALTPVASAGPTLVVRAPNPAQRSASPIVRGSAVPPESTGELSIGAVIRPSAPTVVRPTETQFTPLPSADAPPYTPPTAYTPEVGLPPIRPFPDAHLYPETQAYMESAGYEQASGYSAPPTEVYPTVTPQGYSQTPPQAYSETPSFAAFSAPDPHRQADTSSAEGYSPPTEYLPPVPAAMHGGRATRTDYPPESAYPARTDYPYPQRDDMDYDYDDHDEGPYAAPGGRSIVLPMMIGVLTVVVLAVGGAIGWQVLGSGRSETSSADLQSEAPAVPPAGPSGRTPNTSSAPAAATSSPKQTSVTLPTGATPCGQGQSVSGALTKSAVGTAVTSCAFAEEVRRAYVQLGTAQNAARDGTRAVLATSPVTGQTYTMNCQLSGQLVTCSGGENAVVYVY